MKVRGHGFAQLYAWLAGRDLLIVRADRRPPLAIVPFKLAVEIAVAAERGRCDVTNAFLDLAEQQTSAPVKARQRASEARREPALLLTRCSTRNAQAKVWRAWRRERRQELLAGPHGADAKMLLAFLQSMTMASAADLVEAVARGPWRQAPADTRFE